MDNSNYMENNLDEFAFEDQYKFNIIYEYDADIVDNKVLTQLHVRGSSVKEHVN